jgi:hypothetical protein
MATKTPTDEPTLTIETIQMFLDRDLLPRDVESAVRTHLEAGNPHEALRLINDCRDSRQTD